MRDRVHLDEPAKPTKHRCKRRRLGIYSRFNALSSIDGRTREAALLQRAREDLIKHVGGNPSFTQRLLIERAAVLILRVTQLDTKILSGEMLTRHDNQHGLAWNNALRRTVVALGLEPASARQPTLDDLFPGQAARGRHAAD